MISCRSKRSRDSLTCVIGKAELPLAEMIKTRWKRFGEYVGFSS